MSTIRINVFISHAWSYSGHYDSLSGWIFDENWRSEQASLDFRDFSVPKDEPIHNANNDSELRDALYRQIGLSHVIVIPTGMYANYSKWIQKEINGSKKYNKPILAVNPWASIRRSSVVAAAANKTVGWNKKGVVEGIWDLYNNV